MARYRSFFIGAGGDIAASINPQLQPGERVVAVVPRTFTTREGLGGDQGTNTQLTVLVETATG